MRWCGALCALLISGCYAQQETSATGDGSKGHELAQPRVVGGAASEPEPDTMSPSSAGAAAEPEPVAEACQPHQFVLAGRVVNARDVGGLPVAAGGQVACGNLFRGPPLAALSSEGCSDVAALGIRTVIDLRIDHERQTKPTSACVEAPQVLAPLPIPYGLGPQDYLNDLNSPSVAIAFRAFTDPQAYPIYYHCTWGRDRTGVVTALLLLALGATRQDVMDEYLLSGASVGAYPASLDAVLDEIERRGGAEAFLSEAGISADELAALRERAIAVE